MGIPKILTAILVCSFLQTCVCTSLQTCALHVCSPLQTCVYLPTNMRPTP